MSVSSRGRWWQMFSDDGRLQTERRDEGGRLGGAAVFGLYVVLFTGLNWVWVDSSRDCVTATHVAGVPDAQLIVWVLDWVSCWIRGQCGPLLDAPINYPEPAQLAGSEHFGGSQVLFTPLFLLGDNAILAANWTGILTYPIAGYASYALLTYLGISSMPAFAGSLFLALSPRIIPGHLHILQFLPMYFPMVALGLSRLRRQPTAYRTVVCGVVLLVGLLSSYYTALMLIIVFLVWTLVELASPAPGKRDFALRAGVAFAVPVALMILASIPFLMHAKSVDLSVVGRAAPESSYRVMLLIVSSYAERYYFVVPAVLAGLSALADHRYRRYIVGAIALWFVGGFLVAGGLQLLSLLGLPGILGEAAALVGRFFRIVHRGSIITDFAISVFMAIALQVVVRNLPSFGTIVSGAVIAFLLVSRGAELSRSYVQPIRAYRVYRHHYEEIGRLIRSVDGGPLLEYDGFRSTVVKEEMIAQLVHGVPLFMGHTGYRSRSRNALQAVVNDLPSQAAVGRLVDEGMRWILLRPANEWAVASQAEKVRRRLVQHPLRESVHEVGPFTLVHYLPAPGRSAQVPLVGKGEKKGTGPFSTDSRK